MVNDYGLSSQEGSVDVSSMQASLKCITTEDCSLSGKKEFKEWPCIKA